MARRVIGWILAAAMLVMFGSSLALAHSMHRSASGIAATEIDLALLGEQVVKTYARDGRLCRPSLTPQQHVLTQEGDLSSPAQEAEKKESVGFICLGLDGSRLQSYANAYTYEVDGDRFVLRATRRSNAPQPLPTRYELRGEVRSGRVVLDPTLHRVGA